MSEERIKELFSDEEYVKGLIELGSYDAAAAKLKEDDAEISAEDLRKLVSLAKKKADGELTDEELEDVSGGFIVWPSVLAMLGVAGVLTGVGVGIGGAVAAGAAIANRC